MNQQLLWELFEHTGKIEYYMKYKEMLTKNQNKEG